MKIIALGTGTSQGIPLIGCKCEVCKSPDPHDKRLRSSVYVQSAEAKILIDIGPDFRTQFLDNNLETIDAILLTHEHNDHIIGLDDVRSINFIQEKSIPVYGRESVILDLKKRFDYIFRSVPYPTAPRLEMNIIIDDSPFTFRDIKITPINVMHGRLEIFGFRLNDLAYITDASDIPEQELTKLNDLKVLIINALRLDKHYTHFSLDEALAVIREVSPDKAFITHVSHKMGKVAEWSQKLPATVSPLNDKLIIEV